MWLTILAVLVVGILEFLSLKTYRTFQKLSTRVKKYNYFVLWISLAVVLVLLGLYAFHVPIPSMLP